VQRASRRHFQAVVIHREPDGTASYRIVAMAKSVGDRLSRGQGRIERLVDALNPARLEAARDGQGIAEKTFGGPEEHKGIAVELSIVQKLRSVGASKASHPEQALWHLAFQALGISE